MRDAPVGVARRPAADPAGGDHRRRHLGNRASPCCSRAPASRSISAAAPQEQAAICARRGVNERYLPGVELPPPISGVLRAAELSSAATTSSASRSRRARCPRFWRRTASGSRARRSAGPLEGSCRRSARCRPRSRPSAAARAVAVLGGPSRPPRRCLERRRLGHARVGRPRLRPSACRRARRGRPRRQLTPTSPASSSPGAPRTSPRSPPAAAAPAGPNVAGAAAGKVFAEVDALARVTRRPARDVRRARRRGDLAATVRRRRLAQPPRRRARSPRRVRRGDRPVLGTRPRRSTRCRCWRGVARHASLRRRRSTASPRSSRADRAANAGPRRSPQPVRRKPLRCGPPERRR